MSVAGREFAQANHSDAWSSHIQCLRRCWCFQAGFCSTWSLSEAGGTHSKSWCYLSSSGHSRSPMASFSTGYLSRQGIIFIFLTTQITPVDNTYSCVSSWQLPQHWDSTVFWFCVTVCLANMEFLHPLLHPNREAVISRASVAVVWDATFAMTLSLQLT